MIDTGHLDRTERFVEQLEEWRKEAGLTQEQLARRGGMSPSTYTKFVRIKAIRQEHGDDSHHINAPAVPGKIIGVLRALSEALGRDCIAEGLSIWGHTYTGPNTPDGSVSEESAELLGGLLMRMVKMSPGKLQFIEQMIDNMKD